MLLETGRKSQSTTAQMKLAIEPHPWNVSPAQARRIQESLRVRVIREDRFKREISTVGGVDVGFEDQGKIARAAVVVLSLPDLQLIEQAIAYQPTLFPYVPGLLSFREIPTVLAALKRLEITPDLLLCDGQGIAHPRRFGLACHLGVLTNLPTIGVAKTRLIGTFSGLSEERGSYVPLIDKEEQIGVVLRTRYGIKPVFVSIGHRISLNSAVNYVMACTPRYRLPETTRWADRIASRRGGRFPARPPTR